MGGLIKLLTGGGFCVKFPERNDVEPPPGNVTSEYRTSKGMKSRCTCYLLAMSTHSKVHGHRYLQHLILYSGAARDRIPRLHTTAAVAAVAAVELPAAM